MSKTRLEAFSDGVIAILITILVLELKVPHSASWAALEATIPALLTYALSFVFIGIYWNNHHHMLHAALKISGGVLWANLHLLFWLSLIPFTTAWLWEAHFAALPTASYGVVLLFAALAYTVLQQSIIAAEGPRSRLAAAVGHDRKGKISLALYGVAVLSAFFQHWIAHVIYVLVALMWLVPDRRIEAHLEREK